MNTLCCIVILITSKVSSLNISKNNELNMMVDVINSYQKPTSLAINVCWKQTMKRDFILKFIRAPRVHQFVNSVEDLKERSFKNDLLILADLSCVNSTVFLNDADKVKKFNAPYRWLVVANSYTRKEITDKIQNLNILTDSETIVTEESDNGFIISMPYKIQANSSEFIWEEFGIWTPGNRLTKFARMNSASSVRRKDLRGIAIPMALVIAENSTKTDLTSLNNIQVDTVAKIGYRQIKPLYAYMNATNVNVFTSTWGYLINGTWNGMLGSIVRGEADLTGTMIFLTSKRLFVLEYLSFPSPPTAKFVFREPALSYQNNLFLLPFKPSVWICICALVVILGVILYINAKWEKEKMLSINKESLNETTLRPNVSDIATMIIGAISQQGSSTELKGSLGRAVMFLLFMAFVFFYTSYSANIVVLLQSTSDQIRTLTDLYNSKLELGSEDTSYNRHLFSTATEPIRMAIYKNKIAPRGSKPNFMSLEEGVKKLQTEPFAFNMNLGTGYKAIENYFYEHEKCGLREIEYIQEAKAWQGCRKHSPYKEIYKIGLLRIQEHGVNDRENRIVYAKKPVCSVHGGSFGSVNMMDFYPALLLLLYGMILACCLLLTEILYQRRAQSTASQRV